MNTILMILVMLICGCSGSDDGGDQGTGGTASTGGTGGSVQDATPDTGSTGKLGDPCTDVSDCSALKATITTAQLGTSFGVYCTKDVLGTDRCTFICQSPAGSEVDPDGAAKAPLVCTELGGTCTTPFLTGHVCLP